METSVFPSDAPIAYSHTYLVTTKRQYKRRTYVTPLLRTAIAKTAPSRTRPWATFLTCPNTSRRGASSPSPAPAVAAAERCQQRHQLSNGSKRPWIRVRGDPDSPSHAFMVFKRSIRVIGCWGDSWKP